MIKNLSADEYSVLLSLLSNENRYMIERIVETFSPKGDIVDWKRSQPFNIMQFAEQTAVLKMQGYYLLDGIDPSLVECPCCRNKSSVSLIYTRGNSITNTHDFELCLNCFNAIKLTAIYASAEDGV